MASSSFRVVVVVVEAMGTPSAYVFGGVSEAAAKGVATTTAGSSSSGDVVVARPSIIFDVDDALAAARARAAAGSGAPLSPAAAATAGRTAMSNACGPGLGSCSLSRGGCCSERGTCGWECRGACQSLFSAPGFCLGDKGESSVSSVPPPPASSLPLVPLGSPCGAYLALCAGGAEKEEKRSSCCSVLGFCVAAPSSLCSSSGKGGSFDGDGDGEGPKRTTRRFRLVASRGDANISLPGEPPRSGSILVNGRGSPRPPLSLSVSAGDRVVVEFVNALDEPASLHFHGVRWLDRSNEDGAAGVSQRAVAAGGGGGEEGEDSEGASPLPPPVFVYDFVARDPGTYWWHSHVRGQAADGLRGTLVVRGEGGEEAAPFPSSSSSSGGELGDGDGAARARGPRPFRRRQRQPEAILFVSDWYGAPSEAALSAYLSEENLNGREPTPDALTLNGRSWWWLRGGGGASSSLPPSFEVSEPQGDFSRRSLATCSEPREAHALVRVVNGGAFATVAVSFEAAAAEEEEAEGARSTAAAKSKSNTKPRLRATVVSADAVPTVPTVLDPSRSLRVGVGQRHDVELCALESDEGDNTKKAEEEETKITSVWAVAVADGALFDAPMRLSNATAAVLRFGGGGARDLRFPPPAGINLSDVGAAAAAPPAFPFVPLSPSSSSSTSPPAFVPLPEPTVSHRLTISFNKQQQRRGGEEARGVEGRGRKEEEEDNRKGPSYTVEGVSQRPIGIDEPRQVSLLETEKERAMLLSSSSSSGAGTGGNGSSGSKEEEDENLKKWNLFRHPLGSVVEMLLINDDDVEHSWHLHGHNFWVVGEGKGEEEGGEGKQGKATPTTTITEGRDTVLIPAKSQIKARYVVDSPGAFLAHCHMSWHEAVGLAVVMVDGVE